VASVRIAWERWKTEARRLNAEVYALYLARCDRRVPWYAKALTAAVVAYAFSPIGLIPDSIPVLRRLDDLVLVPLGVRLARAMMPAAVMADCRQQAEVKTAFFSVKPVSQLGGTIVVAIWIVLAVAVMLLARWLLGQMEWGRTGGVGE